MEPRIIKTQEQYRRYLGEVERLAAQDPDPGSGDGGRLELLAKLVEDYEKARFKFRKPGPVEAILFRMEEQGLRQKDLAEILGGKNRASEVLSGKRSLTLPMIRALYEKLAIPPELLIREPAVEYGAGDDVDASDVPADLLVKKTVDFNKAGISKLPDEKPVVYRIQTDGGKTNYAGIAQRGRVQERIAEHLPEAKDAVPGTKVQIEQMKSIDEARVKEARVIARSKPKYNNQGK